MKDYFWIVCPILSRGHLWDLLLDVLMLKIMWLFVKDISKLAAESRQILLENDVSAIVAEPKPSFVGM